MEATCEFEPQSIGTLRHRSGQSMPTVMLVCPHFPPSAASGGYRIHGFARHLPSLGWNVEVVTCAPVPWEPVDNEILARSPVTGPIHYVEFPKRKLLDLASRVGQRLGLHDRYQLWSRAAFMACQRLAQHKRPDIVLTSGPPHSVHTVGMKLKRRFQLPWVADFRDPWVSDPELWPTSRITRRMEIGGETLVVGSADAVVANAPCAKEQFMSAYPAFAQKIHVVTNGYDPDNFCGQRHSMATSYLRVVHTGELYVQRDPRPIIESLDRINAQGGFRGQTVRSAFYGRTNGLLDNMVQGSRGALVELHGQRSHAEVQSAMVKADILLLLDTPRRRVGVPAKLYEYLGTGRPVLAIAEPDGDTAWVLKQSGVVHRIVSPSDVKGIDRALIELLEIVAAGDPSAPNGCRLMKFTRKSATCELAQVLNSMVQIKPHAAGINGR